jgi:glycosyltransferase involved in cell wall biosynthesis
MRQPLKVLVFSPEPSLGGGVVEFSAVLQRRLGPDVQADWFLTGRRPGAVGKALRAIMPFVDAFRLAALLGRERHDVYHLNPSVVPRSVFRDGLFLLVLRMFRRGPVLVFFRGWDAGFFGRIAASPALLRLFRWVYGYADRLLVLASTFAEDLAAAGFPPETVHSLTTMFDGDLFAHAPRVRPPEDGEIRILFMARFIAAKGLFELLEAFQRLARDDHRLTLLLAGDGEERARAEAWCRDRGLQERVRFPGYVGGTDKALTLVNSDIFALPSRHGEGCPNALLEAMAAGLPVVVTPVGGIPDIVRDGLQGLVIPTGSIDALEAALRRLVEDPALRGKMGRRNREEAWKHFEANAVIARLESHYLSLAIGTHPHDALSS